MRTVEHNEDGRAVVRMDICGMSWRCGYVRVPAGHVADGVGYLATQEALPDLDVLGDLTFAGPRAMLGDGWWLGFETCHLGRMRNASVADVLRAVERLADALGVAR